MPKILVIENEQLIRENLIELLEAENFELISAGNGKSGIELAKAHLPDLVMCDDARGGWFRRFEFITLLPENCNNSVYFFDCKSR